MSNWKPRRYGDFSRMKFGKLTLDQLIDELKQMGDTEDQVLTKLFPFDALQSLLAAAREVFLCDTTMMEVDAPLKICGDIHGQFSDMLTIFEMCGCPSKTQKYVFLGDYVDRGQKSLETILLLFAYKLRFPHNVTMLRGNHEAPSINRVYGFYDECQRRYSVDAWNMFQTVFDCMPIAALVNQRMFCMHGGLSPSLMNMSDLNTDLIQRPLDVPDDGVMCDLLWSDPHPFDEAGWSDNPRGLGYMFGPDVVDKFTDANDLDIIVRGHQVVQDGYEFYADKRLVTLFSAPRYCGEFDNHAAVMIVDAELTCSFKVIKLVEEPQVEVPPAQATTPHSVAPETPVEMHSSPTTTERAIKKSTDAPKPLDFTHHNVELQTVATAHRETEAITSAAAHVSQMDKKEAAKLTARAKSPPKEMRTPKNSSSVVILAEETESFKAKVEREQFCAALAQMSFMDM